MHLYLKTLVPWAKAKANFTNDESGLGTIEIIIILAVLVSLALLFRTFADGLFTQFKNDVTKTVGEDSIMLDNE